MPFEPHKMNISYYKEHYERGVLIDCLPINLSKIGFIHKDVPVDEDSELSETPIRLIVYLPKKTEVGVFGTVTWVHSIERLYLSSYGKWIVCDPHFQINEVSNKTQWYPIPNNQKGHLAKGLVNIDGTVYAYGMVRSVFKYTGVKQWDNITTKDKHPNLFADVEASKERMVGSWVGFSAMDGFGQNDIYAGGNKGDFWHYNGKIWTRKDLPLNADISSIACASNGQVYIGCRIGPVLAGRDEKCSIIDESKQITHSAWFKGRIYFADKLGRIYTHYDGDKELTEAVFKTPLPDHMRHRIKGIASCEECLVAYTEEQAYAYDGEIWHEVIEIPSLSKNK